MELMYFIFILISSIISWLAWGIVLGTVFFIGVGLPWAIWEFFMYLTFNNVINLISKIPTFIGFILGFLIALPFAIPGIVVSIWSYIQIIFMGILVINGDPTSTFATNYMTYIEQWEMSGPGSMVIARFFYEHMQWLWGGASMFRGYFFWQNGVWADIGNELPVPAIIIKMLVLSIPIMAMFLLPLIPVVWSLFRPLAGAMSVLPALSDNGDGRD